MHIYTDHISHRTKLCVWCKTRNYFVKTGSLFMKYIPNIGCKLFFGPGTWNWFSQEMLLYLATPAVYRWCVDQHEPHGGGWGTTSSLSQLYHTALHFRYSFLSFIDQCQTSKASSVYVYQVQAVLVTDVIILFHATFPVVPVPYFNLSSYVW